MTNRDRLTELCKKGLACNLPATMKQGQKKLVFAAVKRAQGWLNSSFFSETSSESKYHIERLTKLLEE